MVVPYCATARVFFTSPVLSCLKPTIQLPPSAPLKVCGQAGDALLLAGSTLVTWFLLWAAPRA